MSRTAAWFHSWYASALTFIAFASASPFLKMISASASPCARMAAPRPSASSVSRCRSALGQRLDPLPLDLGLLQDGRDQLLLAARDLGLLHLDLLLLLDLLDPDLLGDDLLLHDVGLDLVGLVRLRLLLLDRLVVLRLLDLQVALRLGLLGLRERLGEHPLLVGLRLGDRGLPRARRRA